MRSILVISVYLFLLSTVLAATPTPTPEPIRCFIQGGPIPAACSEEGQYQWDSKTCRFICNQPVNCFANPCDAAVRDGVCTRDACVADYWTGCNFICTTPVPTTKPTSTSTSTSTPTSPVDKCRTNEGLFVSIGEKYKYQCNECTCGENGQASICTRIGCQQTCYDDTGKGYATGATRTKDCNTCTCQQNSTWQCTNTCTTPAPTCAKRCATCAKGAECRQDQNGCMKCQAIQTTTAPTCPPNLCEDKCEFRCVPDFDKCTYKCKEPSLGETVRTISFQLHVEVTGRPISDAKMVVILADMMREIATNATISLSSLVINNDDFQRTSGRVNSKSGDWLIKIGFRAIQHPEGDERAQFVRKLKDIFKTLPTITTDEPMASIYDATNEIGLFLDQTSTITEAKEFYEFQTCQDGRTITADKQCEAVTFAATGTSSSSSIPIVAIIAPIIGGIVLIAIIATVLIIRRRRADTVKTIENIARDTADMETNPAIAAVEEAQVEGADRV